VIHGNAALEEKPKVTKDTMTAAPVLLARLKRGLLPYLTLDDTGELAVGQSDLLSVIGDVLDFGANHRQRKGAIKSFLYSSQLVNHFGRSPSGLLSGDAIAVAVNQFGGDAYRIETSEWRVFLQALADEIKSARAQPVQPVAESPQAIADGDEGDEGDGGDDGQMVAVTSGADGDSVQNSSEQSKFEARNEIIRSHRSLRPEALQLLSRESLMELVLNQSEVISALRRQLHHVSQANVRALTKLKGAEKSRDDQLVLQDAQLNRHFVVEFKSNRELAHCTLKSRMSIAVRRNIGNTAATDIGVNLLLDKSHHAICRWEVQCEASRIVSARTWYNDMENALQDYLGYHPRNSLHLEAWPGRMPLISVHSWSTDATNTNIWKGASLHGLRAISGYLLDWSLFFKEDFSLERRPGCICKACMQSEHIKSGVTEKLQSTRPRWNCLLACTRILYSEGRRVKAQRQEHMRSKHRQHSCLQYQRSRTL